LERAFVRADPCDVKFVLLALATFHAVAVAAPVRKLSDFELTDQNATPRRYQFPKTKVTVMTVADHKGSAQLAPWIERLHQRYQKRIDIDGVADVSMIAKPFHSVFRAAFRKQLTYSVMLDWEGFVVKQFGYSPGVANIYVIDTRGNIVKQVTGSVSEEAMREITAEIDRAMGAGTPSRSRAHAD
jgi:hypothetical protein